ncbi:MAG: cupin domain-containing protein [Verrucomicrobiales bacterium]|nr:cupin domain-containing protein [Verrucomicrobiales bacterium]
MFIHADAAPQDEVDGRRHTWHCRPGFTPTEDLIFVKCVVPPGKFHAFHAHPNKEEMIYILAGEAEQWIEQKFEILGPGESAYIPKSVIHATFNASSDRDLEFIAVITPLSSEGELYQPVEHLEPWKSITETRLQAG